LNFQGTSGVFCHTLLSHTGMKKQPTHVPPKNAPTAFSTFAGGYRPPLAGLVDARYFHCSLKTRNGREVAKPVRHRVEAV